MDLPLARGTHLLESTGMNKYAWALSLPLLLLSCAGKPDPQGTGTDSGTSGEASSTQSVTASDTTTESGGSTSAGSATSGSTSGVTSVTDGSASTGATSDTTASGTSGTSASTSSGTQTTTSGTTGEPECTVLKCGTKVLQCGNCIDDDNDGLVDTQDPECVTPCDDDEGKFATGIPGDNMDPCKQDCFFDGNSGAGDDKCQWNLKCDPQNPGAPTCPYDPNYKMCPMGQPQQCIDQCFTPNGCDCFGCCTVTFEGQDYDVFLGDPNCSLANIPQCKPCTKNMDCDNPCMPEQCEVCFGEVEPPRGCEEPKCPAGVDACLINADCPDGTYCQTGCCFPLPG